MNLSKLILTVKRLLCPHRTVEIRRVHPEQLAFKGWKNHLYIDDRGVFNFAVCACCGHTFKTAQRDRLFAQEGWHNTKYRPVPAIRRYDYSSLLSATEAEMADWRAEVSRLEAKVVELQDKLSIYAKW